MKLKSLHPMLWVDDVQATINYYTSVLQFAEFHFEESFQWGYVIRDEVEIMFAKPNEHMPYDGPKFTGSLYLNTENVDDWWTLLKGKANVFYEIENFDYGMREFAIRDCNGYILQFGQPLDEPIDKAVNE